MNRLCKTCDNKFPIDHFPQYTRMGKTYHHYECNDCYDPAKHYKKNREKILERSRDNRLSNPEQYLWRGARSRAKTAGIEFSISVDDIRIPTHCPILGYPMTPNSGRRNVPSLDRIDPAEGYTPENIQVISSLANTMKNDATPDELLAFAKWVLANYQSQATTD